MLSSLKSNDNMNSIRSEKEYTDYTEAQALYIKLTTYIVIRRTCNFL